MGATAVGAGVSVGLLVGVGVTETDGDGDPHGECDGRSDGVRVGAGGIGMPLAQTHITTLATWTRW